tara:strand:+ start:203 stop:610 length:408 start_codon:yes stop_codon:yes gene_type:complete
MRYLVDRGTGTIVPLNDDLVIVDVDHDEFDSENILYRADKCQLWDKAIIGLRYEFPLVLTDKAIASELNDYAYNDEMSADNDDNYFYCLNNPDTWSLIRDAIVNDDPFWNEYSDTWTNAILTVAERHRERNGVAE